VKLERAIGAARHRPFVSGSTAEHGAELRKVDVVATLRERSPVRPIVVESLRVIAVRGVARAADGELDALARESETQALGVRTVETV